MGLEAGEMERGANVIYIHAWKCVDIQPNELHLTSAEDGGKKWAGERWGADRTYLEAI